jgi:hypothetical protein
MNHLGQLFALCLLWAGIGHAGDSDLLARTAQEADEFQRNAMQIISTETLRQCAFMIPPHPVVTVGAAAEALQARFITHEVVSEYSVGRLKGSQPTDLLEFRELTSMDGKPVQTPAAARRALNQDVQSGEDRVRKQILSEFTKFGLADVATDYGLILLAFTTRGQPLLDIHPAGEAFVGTEETVKLDWVQRTGGALEFRGRKVARRPLAGSIWIRKSDGMPLRIFSWFEHEEPKHTLRDEASVDYVVSAMGFPVPVTVVHRHYVDGEGLTENLYTYEPFRLFTTNTTIHYSGTVAPK